MKARNNYWSAEQCVHIIKENKDDTQYYNGVMSFNDMYNMLKDCMGFGEAETKVIIASLIQSGATLK